MTPLSYKTLEIIIVLLVCGLLYAFRLHLKLAWYKVKLSLLRANVERLEAYRSELEHRVEQARWRAKHHLPPAA